MDTNVTTRLIEKARVLGRSAHTAFIDEFGPNGLKFSICERDFSEAMRNLGNYISESRNLCIDDKLVDTDPATPGVQADCRVSLFTPTQDPANSNKIVFVEDSAPMPQCSPEQSDDTQAVYPCWKLVADKTRCWARGQLVAFVRDPSERNTPLGPGGTRIGINCWACTEAVPGTPPAAGCDY